MSHHFSVVWDNVKVAGEVKGQIVILLESC